MKPILNEFLSHTLYQNYLKESSTSQDIGKYEPLITNLVKKIYPESLVAQIASIQPTSSPIAKIATLYSLYTGNDSNNNNEIHLENSRIVTIPVSADANFVVGNQYTSGGNAFTVFYKETAKQYSSTTTSAGDFLTREFADTYVHLLVRIDSGSITTGDVFLGETLLYVSSNRNVIKRIFKDYSGILENNTDLREINFEIRTSIIESKSKKIRTKFTQEKLQDLQALYKEKAYDLVAEFIGDEIRQEIDREIIQYLKNISTPMPRDVDLSISLARTGGDLGGITYDLYASIFLAIEEIVRATKRNRTMFILADSATVAILMLNPLHSEAKPEDSNPYYVGQVGAYPVYCDPYSTEHYVMVGYRYFSDNTTDSGLIFSPYSNIVVETPGTDAPFTQNFLTMNRYAYTRHPQDSGTGLYDSDFFRYFAVNISDPGDVIPNLTDQIRTKY